MARAVVLAFLFALFAIAVGEIALSPYWKATNVAPPASAPVTITLSLKQQNLEILESLFWERSNPKEAKYAQYLNRKEIADIVSPDGASERAVRQWLLQAGFKDTEIVGVETKDVLYLHGTVEQIEATFGVKYEIFEHKHVAKQLWRSVKPCKLPEEIEEHIQLIHGIYDFPPVYRKNRLQNKDKIPSPIIPNKDEWVQIQSVNGRSQSAGAALEVTVLFSCPTNQPFCYNGILVNVQSVNPNIVSESFASVGQNQCPDNLCTIVLEVEFYVPYNITVTGVDPDVDQSPVVVWPYPVVVNPHVVPQTLWDLYSMGKNPIVTNMTATQSVVEFEQQYYSPQDLQEFFVLMGLPRDAPITEVGINDATQPGGEANLDIQWIMAMAPGAPTFFWSISANSPIEIDHILTWAYQMGNYTNPPLVSSLSYGMTEGNVDKYLGSGYLNRTNAELQKLAVQGLTIIIADGDAGANDVGPPPMSQLRCNPSHPDWPSNSPYVTAIGSTFITPLSERICYVPGGEDCLKNPLGEVTVSVDMGMSWTTGGGFSNIETRPGYQSFAVDHYLKNQSGTVPPETYFNPSGRAYADAVTVGHNLECVVAGEIVAIDGTSASAPIFAGMVTVLNNARLNNNLSPLGFITPLLYQAFEERPSCWTDVTIGNNKCATYGWQPICCETGFTATTGWDPVSGVGSPNMDWLLSYVLSQP